MATHSPLCLIPGAQFLQDFEKMTYDGTICQIKGTSFNTYCNNENLFGILQSYVGASDWGKKDYLSLQGMFNDNLLSSTEGNIIDIWKQICQDNTSNITFSDTITGNTVNGLMFALMQEIYMILAMIYFIHDTALKIVNALYSNYF